MTPVESQEAGSVPPQESGLLYNSWTGKHHSEMRYWHQTWMPIWSRPELLAKSDEWFIQRQVQCHFVALFPTVLGSFEVSLTRLLLALHVL